MNEPPWTDAEKSALIDASTKMTKPEFAEFIGRTPHAIDHKQRQLGVKWRIFCRGHHPRNPKWWSSERQALLLEAIAAGFDNHEIAAYLGTTRNAVIGKRNRMGWNQIKAEPIVAPKNWGFDKIGTRDCCWPIGDPGEPDFHMCGEPAWELKPYCAMHQRRAWKVTRDD